MLKYGTVTESIRPMAKFTIFKLRRGRGGLLINGLNYLSSWVLILSDFTSFMKYVRRSFVTETKSNVNNFPEIVSNNIMIAPNSQ